MNIINLQIKLVFGLAAIMFVLPVSSIENSLKFLINKSQFINEHSQSELVKVGIEEDSVQINQPLGIMDDDCIINTINSSFEQPFITSGTLSFQHHNAVPGWSTTASDRIIEVWASGYEGFQAYEGRQFIELNASQVSGVYQDYDTPYPIEFTFSYAHRARRGIEDVCRVMAGPPGGPLVEIDRSSATRSSWVLNQGTYSVPAGQTRTRFLFESVSTGSNNPTVGNFLDAIEFTANIGVISENPYNLDCINTVTAGNIVSVGTGNWLVNPGNPSTTYIDDPISNTPTIVGFTVPGSYFYTWTNGYCSVTVEVVYNGDAPITTPIH